MNGDVDLTYNYNLTREANSEHFVCVIMKAISPAKILRIGRNTRTSIAIVSERSLASDASYQKEE